MVLSVLVRLRELYRSFGRVAEEPTVGGMIRVGFMREVRKYPGLIARFPEFPYVAMTYAIDDPPTWGLRKARQMVRGEGG